MTVQTTAVIAATLLAWCLAPVCAAPISLPDADMESPGRDAWESYGTPVRIEKVPTPHAGRQALRVVTDNKNVMGGGFEGVSRSLGERNTGDRLRVSFWLRPLAGREVWVGIGRTAFEQVWRFINTDWMEAVCDFRARAPGKYHIWITQHDGPNEFLLDDFAVRQIRRLELGRAAPDERVALEDEAARLWFCRRTGALCGIENRATGEVIAPLGERQPLFSLGLLRPDGRGTEEVGFDGVTLQSLRAEKDGRALALVFALKEWPIRVTCRVSRVAPGEWAFTAEMDNRSDRTVLDLTYPIVRSVKPAAEPEALTLVSPDACGQIERDALRSAGCDALYPGRAVMGWLDLFGERGGVSLAAHDKTRTGTRLTALPALRDSFDLSLSKEVVIPARTVWKSPEHVLIVHAGDWHVAADRYRAWARRWLGAPDIPRWMRDADGWVLMGVQNGYPFWRIPDVYSQAEWMGTEYLHVQGQGIDNLWFDAEGKRHPHDMTFPFPSPRFGTRQALKQAVRDIHARNGRVLFYFLYERWTPSHSTADDLGSAPRAAVPADVPIPGLDFYETNALIERPGGQVAREHPWMAARVMCLAAPGWQEWMRHWAIDIYAKQYGADGFYWDVMGRNGPFRCFNERHGHRGHNEWARGSAAVLERVLREGRRINPEYSCAIEGAQDALGPWVGFHLMSGATRTPEVVRYTFPELCLVDGFSNHYWQWTQPEKARRVFLNGERFDLHGYHAEVRKYVWLRKRLRPFIDWPARFVDTVGLTVSDPAVAAKRFVRDDGGNRAVLVTLLNEAARADALVTVRLGPVRRVAGANLFTPGGAIRPLSLVRQGNGTVTFRAPTEPVSAALFVEAVEPQLRVVATLDQIRTPGQDGIELTLFYPAGKIVHADVTVRAPAGVALQPVPERRPAESAAVERRVWVPAGGLNALPGWEKIRAEVRWQGGEAAAWSLLCPPLANGDFERLRPDGHLAYWPASPSTDHPAQGKYCLKLERPAGGGAELIFVNLLAPIKPSTRYRFSAKIKRDAAGSGAHAAVVEYEEGSKLQVSATVGAGGKAGEWQEFSTEFTSHPNPRSSGVYLYLGKSKVAWFDDLKLEEVR